MKKLNFELPEMFSIVWKDNNTRDIWKYRIGRISEAYNDIEFLSVAQNIRRAHLASIHQDELVEFTKKAALFDLVVIPVGMTSGVKGYSARTISLAEGQPWNYRVFISRKENISNLIDAYNQEDNEKIGLYLGYPKCCRDFFQNVWVGMKNLDTSWQMALNSDNTDFIETEKTSVITIDEEDYLQNILLRWLGIRFVPHLPHSFNCQETKEFAKKMISIGNENGYDQEMKWLKYLLKMDMEWSALHGIGQVITPIFKFRFTTDATGKKYIVKKVGNKNIITPNSWLWEDNGFSTYQGMEESHLPVLKAINDLMIEEDAKNILDLGCGNGYLLKKTGLLSFGIDLKEDAITHAKELMSDYNDNFIVGNILEYNWDRLEHPFDIVVISPARLKEFSNEDKETVKKQLIKHAKRVVIEAYSDWLNKYENIEQLAEEIGFELDKIYKSKYAQAAIVKNLVLES